MTTIDVHTKTIAIIDYGVGNIRSLTRTLENTPMTNTVVKVVLTKNIDEVLNADMIMLPGVGSFGAAAEQLAPWRDVLHDAIKNGKPTLAVCLGMQILFNQSEESPGQGLGVFSGNVTRLNAVRVPNMGWNQVTSKTDMPTPVSWAYFAHSFACRPTDQSIVAATTTYEGDEYVSILRSGNVLALQFHPEKSDLAGVAFVHDFVQEMLS
jgi:glutamine amidotransferase